MIDTAKAVEFIDAMDASDIFTDEQVLEELEEKAREMVGSRLEDAGILPDGGANLTTEEWDELLSAISVPIQKKIVHAIQMYYGLEPEPGMAGGIAPQGSKLTIGR